MSGIADYLYNKREKRAEGLENQLEESINDIEGEFHKVLDTLGEERWAKKYYLQGLLDRIKDLLEEIK